jgi:hypothetical protein
VTDAINTKLKKILYVLLRGLTVRRRMVNNPRASVLMEDI